MAFLQWRRFNFFDKEVVKEPGAESPFNKLKDVHITCCSSGKGIIVVGDANGNVYFLDRQLMLSTFKAYEVTITHLEHVKQNPVLVSSGSDEPNMNVLIKIWNTDKNDNSGKTACLRVIRCSPSVTAPLSAIAVHESMTLLALGFDDSNILLVKGDIAKERNSKLVLFKASSSPITGLGLRVEGKQILLFAVTMDEVFSYTFTTKNREVKLLDPHGCPQKCSVMSDAKQHHQFVIGRQEAVYFYQHDSRGPCLAFEGTKIMLLWFKSYLVVVGKDEKVLQTSSVAGLSVGMHIVTIYDIQNKFIAYSSTFPPVIDVVSEWGSLFIITQDGKMFNLHEKDTQSKLDLLFRKNQYGLAISLAKSQQYDEDGLVDIFRQYGDHLYSKGDHDGAIAQYKKTIGKLEASYVIRKFLDAQRIHNLTDYLQCLHEKGFASEDHTTLLLNCYTKLKDKNKLNEFIMPKDHEVDFDVEIAMKVCRQAGYHDHALYLAEKHKQHDWYLKIQIEDLKNCEKALKYIRQLDFPEVEKNFKKYGKVLMQEVPEQTTDFLKSLYTGIHKGTIPPEEFIHIFDRNSLQLMEFLEHTRKEQLPMSNSTFSILLELYLQAYNQETEKSSKAAEQQKIMEMLKISDSYDTNQALILCKINNFKPGILYIYEREKLYQQILSYHIENKDYENAVKTCRAFGNNEPNLWVQALWYFSQLDHSQKTHTMTILNEIEERNLLSPILVVEIMSKSHTATLELIKEYICRYLQKEERQISEDEDLIKQYKKETEKMRSQIEELKTSAKIFQVSKCSGCMHQLELPSVHFLCNHSYHQQCFESYSAENDAECPLCYPENRKVLDIIHSQNQHRELHEEFHHNLERSEDSFSVVADYFGRGVFSKVTLVMDPKRTNTKLDMK